VRLRSPRIPPPCARPLVVSVSHPVPGPRHPGREQRRHATRGRRARDRRSAAGKLRRSERRVASRDPGRSGGLRGRRQPLVGRHSKGGSQMKAKAAVLFEVGKRLELCDVDVAAPQAGEVLIRMAAGGVCHSDLHALTGREIKHFAGVSTFSEYSVVPEKAVLKIPDDLPLDKAALLGCAVITGYGAVVNCARVKPGASVVVFGAGGVGLNAVQGAAIAGAEKIIAVDLVPKKLEYAREFGATHVVNASDGDPVAAVRALTSGRGVDYAFEVIGLPKTMRQAYDCLAKRGVCVVVGVAPMTMEVSVSVMSLVYEERVLTGSVYGSSRPAIDIPKLIALYRAGKLKLDELLTRTYPFREINEAYAALERGEVARSVVTF